MFSLARSSSDCRKPCSSTRLASMSRASRPCGISPSLTPAPSVNASVVRPMKLPFEPPAPRKGALGFLDLVESVVEHREVEPFGEIAAIVADGLRLLGRQLEADFDVGASRFLVGGNGDQRLLVAGH